LKNPGFPFQHTKRKSLRIYGYRVYCQIWEAVGKVLLPMTVFAMKVHHSMNPSLG